MLNRVVLVGRLTKDAELRYTPSNVAVATFTIAVDRPFSNRNQQDPNAQQNQPTADYLPVVIWRNQAENVKRYTTKGSMVAVEGRIQTRSYDGNDGIRRYVTEIIADNVVFLETKGSQEALNQRNASSANNQNNNNYYQEPQMDRNNSDEDKYENNIVFTKDDLPY